MNRTITSGPGGGTSERRDGPAGGSRELARRLRALGRYVDRATVVGIVLLVVLVTLPRLRNLAIHENELDALRTLDVLAGEVFAGDAERPERLGELFGGDADQVRESRLARRLADTRVIEGGRRLMRYGYLFELVDGPHGLGLRAWPVERGRTGRGAFWLGPGGELRGDANRSARWSGPERPPAPETARGWRAIDPAAARGADL